MSIEWIIYCRDKPDLANAPSAVRFTLEAIELGDPAHALLRRSDWADEIRWCVHASSRAAASTLGFEFSDRVARDARGAIWDEATNGLRWCWWDEAALKTRALAWLEERSLHELQRWLETMRELEGEVGSGDGPLAQVEAIAIARLATLAASAAKTKLVLGLWKREEHLEPKPHELLADAVLALPATGATTKLQAKVKSARDEQRIATTRLPKTAAELSALWDAAHADEVSLGILRRVAAERRLQRVLGEVALAKARAGERALLIQLPIVRDAAEFAVANRAAFATRGPLASALVSEWNHADRYAAQVDSLLDRRRRAGELFVPLPDDLQALVKQGQAQRAAEEYAKRYGLTLEVAKRVVRA